MAKKSLEFDTYYIYSLSDPRTGKIRYIGQSRNIIIRLSGHVSDSQSNSFNNNPKKCTWINELKTLKLKPIINVIEECNYINYKERETYHIRQAIANGTDLLNSNSQSINLNKSTSFNIDLPNKIIFIIEEITKNEKSSREIIIQNIIINHVESLDLKTIDSQIENFVEFVNKY